MKRTIHLTLGDSSYLWRGKLLLTGSETHEKNINFTGRLNSFKMIEKSSDWFVFHSLYNSSPDKPSTLPFKNKTEFGFTLLVPTDDDMYKAFGSRWCTFVKKDK